MAAQPDAPAEPTAGAPPARTLYCTIATAQELPRALLLGESLRAAYGAVDFRLLLLEQPAVVARLRAHLPEAVLLAPSELGCAQWRSMAFYYDRREYAAALKPALLRTLLRAGPVVYLDPDIAVYAPLAALERQLGEADVIVLAAPAEDSPEGRGAETAPDRPGPPLDLSVIGIGRSAAAAALLDRLQAQLIEGGHESPEHGLHPGARWAEELGAAPRLRLVRSRQYDLEAGALTLDADQTPQTPDGPLCLFHHGRHAGAPRDAALQVLRSERARRLAQSPYRRFAATPYSLGCYEGGEPIPLQHRRAFWQLPSVNRRSIADPFAARPLLMQLAAQLGPEPGGRRHRLPGALIGYAGKLAGALLESAAPGGRERVVRAVHGAAARGASARYYAGQLLDQAMPGSRERLLRIIQAATTSPNPAIRRTAAVMLAAAGVLP